MRKKFLFLLLISSVIPIWAHDFTAVAPSGQTLYYTILTDSTVSVSSNYHLMHGRLVIPDSVENGANMYVVSQIASYAFSLDTTLTSVTIPSSITEIKQTPFNGCYNIDTVYYFAKSPSIQGGENLAMFNNCFGIHKVIFGEEVTWIPAWMFNNCPYIDVVELPDSCSAIGILAFSNCIGLKEINMGQKTHTIMQDAFKGCTALQKVNFRGDLSDWCRIRFINAYSQPLYYADSLMIADTLITSITIPEGIDSVNDYAFYHYIKLSSVIFPDSLKVIGNFAFSECGNITNILLPNSIENIGQYAFARTNISEITIPENVKQLAEAAFYCRNLSTVYFNATNANFPVGYTGPFALRIYNNGTTDSIAPIRNFIIGDNVESLPQQLLWRDTALYTITIPSNVEKIGSKTFLGCLNLRSIILKSNTPPTITFNTFEELPTTINLTVPCGASENYRNAPYWNVYQNVEEDCNNINKPQIDENIVYFSNGMIHIEGVVDEEIYIFDIMGRRVQNTALPAGVYLVKRGNHMPRKITVLN